MKKTSLVASLAAVLLLAGCGSSTVTYRMRYKTSNPDDYAELGKMAVRVIQRRVEHLKGEVKQMDVQGEGAEQTIALTVTGADTAEKLTEELTAPYSFLLVRQAEPGEKGVEIGEFGTFVETGLDQRHIFSVEWAKDSDGKGALKINLTPEGTELMRTIGEQYDGKQIAIVVRGALMSRSQAKKGQDKLAIRGVPTPEMAEVFADDTNVALYVSFTPVP